MNNSNPKIALKDLDCKEDKVEVNINGMFKDTLLAQIIADANFLALHNINDYSLLLGIHRLQNKDNTANYKKITLDYIYKNLTEENVRHKPFYEIHEGGLISEDCSKIFFFGIIDILTKYEYFCEINR